MGSGWRGISLRRRAGYYGRVAFAMLGALLALPGSAALAPTDPRRERDYAEQNRREGDVA